MASITVDINGRTYSGWESCEIYDDIEQLGNDFTLTTNLPADKGATIKKGQSLMVRIDGERLITGYIVSIEPADDANSSRVIVKGSDKTCDFVDSKVSNKTFTPPVGFVQILKRLLTKVGFEVVSNNTAKPLVEMLGADQISVINNYSDINGPIADFQTNEGISFPPGESAYELIKKLADKRQLVLSTDGYGNIVIDGIGETKTITDLQRLEDDTKTIKNNVINAQVFDSLHDRYYEYTIASKGTGGTTVSATAADKAKTDAEKNIIDPINNDTATNYTATVYDTDIRRTRKFYAVVTALNSSQCKQRAEWELNIRKAKDFTYTCTVAGFRQTTVPPFGNYNLNPLWKPNQKVFLIDEVFELQGEYLIRSVRYKQSESGGSVTELVLVDEYSYTYSTFKPAIKKGKKGTNKAILFAEPV